MTQITTIDGHAISELCFGAMQFGGTADAKASREMYDACRETGVNFFDTAHAYTGGASEEFLGQFVATERDNVFVATKVAYTGGSGRDNVYASFDVSCQRLNLDVVDLLYLHRWDDQTPLEETFGALAELQSVGRIRYIGVSNFAAWQVMKAQRVAEELGTRIDMLQPMYSLVKRQAEVELFPMALSEGFAVAAYSPLGGGLLTGKYTKGGDGRLATDKRYAARYGQDWMHQTAAGLAEVASAEGVDAATLAVAWAQAHPAVSAPIISARSAAQLAPSLAALNVPLTQELYEAISALSRRPAPATDRLEES